MGVAVFPLEGLPRALSVVTRINPLAYGVDGLRGELVNQAHFGIGLDLIVLGVITAVVLWIGTYLFSKIEA